EDQSRRQAHDLLVELDAAHRQLAAYADQVERLTLAAERARMARELHDTLAQGLTGLVLQLEALEEHVERADTPKVTQVINQMKGRARSALADSRRAISDLRLVLDEPASLLDAIAEEARRFSN